MAVFRSNLLTEIAEATLCEFELAFARWRGKYARRDPPNGLVVSSDDEVSRRLAESLGQCGVAPLFACTVVESRIVLAGREVLVVLCNERLADGREPGAQVSHHYLIGCCLTDRRLAGILAGGRSWSI